MTDPVVILVRDTLCVETSEQPPAGYVQPITAWLVEYVDPREPDGGSHQVGAFTSEGEAQELLRRMEDDGFFAELRINMVSIHERVADWEWDR